MGWAAGSGSYNGQDAAHKILQNTQDPAKKGFGELGGTRTLDLQIKSPLLYQLSYELPKPRSG